MNRKNIIQDILESISNMDSKNISKIIESYLTYDIYEQKDIIMAYFGVDHKYKDEDEEDDNDEEDNEEEYDENYDLIPHTDCRLVYFIHLKEIAILDQLYCGRIINCKDNIFTTTCNEIIQPSTDYIFIKNECDIKVFKKKSFKRQEFLSFLKCKELIYKKEVKVYGKDFITYENYIILNNEHISLSHNNCNGGYINDWKEIYDIFMNLIKEVNIIYSE